MKCYKINFVPKKIKIGFKFADGSLLQLRYTATIMSLNLGHALSRNQFQISFSKTIFIGLSSGLVSISSQISFASLRCRVIVVELLMMSLLKMIVVMDMIERKNGKKYLIVKIVNPLSILVL
jgi:hypothetical protein